MRVTIALPGEFSRPSRTGSHKPGSLVDVTRLLLPFASR